MSKPTYLVVGHITRDVIPTGNIRGGTALYAAAMAVSLGYEARIATSGSSSGQANSLGERIGDVHRIPSEFDTTFEYEWVDGTRIQRLTQRAARIHLADIPRQWLDSTIWHLGPVADEIDPAIITGIPSPSFLGVTPQGWLRAVDRENVVHPTAWASADRILARTDAVVLSRHDIPDAHDCAREWSRGGPAIAVTEAENGTTVWSAGVATHIPTLRVDLVDELGAGDVFATAFFDRLAKGHAAIEAGRFAAIAASLSVTRSGADSLPSLDDITSVLDGWT